MLLAANPLDDLANVRRIEGVMVRGRWIPAARLRALRDSLARLQAPLRVLAARFDSLVHAGKLDDAEATLASLRRARGGYAPIAYVVTSIDARRLLPTDPAAAVRLLDWNASMFPGTHAAHAELARGYLARGAAGDTARAVAAARRALAMYPTHATAKAIVNGR